MAEIENVNIFNQAELMRKKELWEAGDQIERGVVSGDEMFLAEEDRLWLKAMVERSGLNLKAVEGKADLSGQADQLMAVFGKEKLLRILPELIAEVVDNPGGEVFKGESGKPVDAKEQIKLFVSEYIDKQLTRDRFVFDPNEFSDPRESWKKNTVYRIEAVMSVTNKLLWVLQTDDPEEAKRRQETSGILKHFRERIIRGAEKAGEVVATEVKRADEKIIRHLPPKSVGLVLEHFTRV